MIKKQITKKALLSSIFALALCVAMLIGTTFAWFTDTATTVVNKVQAGKLDVALEMLVNDEWVNAEGQALNFVAEDGRDNILWEPGCTYELPTLRVANNGDLAIKYQVILTGIKGDAKLNETIEWRSAPRFDNGTFGYGNPIQDNVLFSGVLYPKDEVAATNFMSASSTFKIVGTMDSNAGNEYQGLTIDGISITVIATQASKEVDINGSEYDIDATYDTEAVTADELTEIMQPVNGVINLDKNYVLTDSWTSLKLTDGNVYNPQYVGKITVNGNGHYIAGLTTALLADNFCTDLTINDLTVKNSVIKYTGITNSGNGAFVGYMNGYPVALNNCHIDNVTVNGKNGNLQVGGFIGQFDVAKITITNCTVKNSVINGDSSAGGLVGMLMTNNGIEKTISGCKVENCKINSKDEGDWRIGAIVGTANGDGILTIRNCSETGNTYSMPNGSDANPGHNLYGRIKGTAQIR